MATTPREAVSRDRPRRRRGDDVVLLPKYRGLPSGRFGAVLKLTRDPIDGRVYPGRLEVERRMLMARRVA